MEERYYATGRRKTAVARVWITQGTGQVKVNERAVEEYFGEAVRDQALMPLRTLGLTGEFDIWATVKGGGISGQAGALRHGLARALVVANEDYRKPLRKNGLPYSRLPHGGAQEVRPARRPQAVPVLQALERLGSRAGAVVARPQYAPDRRRGCGGTQPESPGVCPLR